MAVNRRLLNPTLIAGLVAVIAGSVLLLDHLGYLHAYQIFRLWPIILIVFGVAGLIQGDGSSKLVGNSMLTVAGVALLLMELNYLRWGQAWPIILICLGLLLVWESLRPKTYTPSASPDAYAHSVFSGVEKNITASDFKEGTADAVFGSVQLDFSQADMVEEKAYLTVNAVFGSIEIRVPDRWQVVIEANAVFGSCENKTRPPLPTTAPKTLIIRGDAVFGSIEVRN